MRYENRFEYRMAERRSRGILLVVLILLLLGAGWFYYVSAAVSPAIRSTPVSDSMIGLQPLPSAEVTMYSSSTCPVCTAMREDLRKAGILYTEYFIDKEAYRKVELEHRLQKYQIQDGRVGTPVLFVGDVMYMGRARIEDLRKDMR